jgi:hypothetical protein
LLSIGSLVFGHDDGYGFFVATGIGREEFWCAGAGAFLLL